MTTKDLALFFGKSEKTVRRCAESAGISFVNGVKKVFTKDEVEHLSKFVFGKVPEAVQEAIGLAFGPRTNVQGQPRTNAEVKKLPSGAQLHEIRILAEKGVLTKDQVADAMGIPRQSAYQKPVQQSLELEGPRLTTEELERDLMSLVPKKVTA